MYAQLDHVSTDVIEKTKLAHDLELISKQLSFLPCDEQDTRSSMNSPSEHRSMLPSVSRSGGSSILFGTRLSHLCKASGMTSAEQEKVLTEVLLLSVYHNR